MDKVLDINPNYGEPSYGCGDYLAYDDSRLGEWKLYEYSLPST